MPSGSLSVHRGIALYVGALLGPGLLLLPGLAAAEAGPASVLAWLVLLVMSGLFAAVFTALGTSFRAADGAAGYAAAGLGEWSRTAVAWCFLAGVVLGAPVVCLIGAGYVTSLTGAGTAVTGQLLNSGIAALLLVAVLVLALCGVRSGAAVQLSLMTLLVAVIAVAVTGGAPAAHAANWAPFAPHGWASIGHAASTLMLSFVGWEAIAPLTSQFRNPARQLPS